MKWSVILLGLSTISLHAMEADFYKTVNLEKNPWVYDVWRTVAKLRANGIPIPEEHIQDLINLVFVNCGIEVPAFHEEVKALFELLKLYEKKEMFRRSSDGIHRELGRSKNKKEELFRAKAMQEIHQLKPMLKAMATSHMHRIIMQRGEEVALDHHEVKDFFSYVEHAKKNGVAPEAWKMAFSKAEKMEEREEDLIPLDSSDEESIEEMDEGKGASVPDDMSRTKKVKRLWKIMPGILARKRKTGML